MKFRRIVLVVVAVTAVAAFTVILANRPHPEESTPVGEIAPVSEGAPTAPPEEAAPNDLAEAGPTSAPAEQTASRIPTETSPVPSLPVEPPAAVPSPETLQELVPEESEVEWEETSEHPPLDDARLSEAQRQAVQSSPVPVLLPDNDALLGTALISTGDYFYAAAMHEDDVSVSVIGASKVVRAPGVPEPPAFGDHDLTLGRSQGGVGLSFKAYGVYYDVEVDCPDPVNDPRCAENAYLLELADRLLMAAADKRSR
jgi:hypothetical protein